MARCLVDVKFLFNEKDYIFAKQVLVCGITKNGESFIKEITYDYPKIVKEQDENEDKDIYDPKSPNVYKNGFKNGNLEFPRKDLELSRTLTKFSTIIVKSSTEKDFITNYINVNANVVEI